MSERISLDYNGREVTFREDQDEWHCFPLKLSAPSLSGLKRKIDKLDGTARRCSIAAYRIGYGGEIERADIIMVAKPKDWSMASLEAQREGAERRIPTVWALFRNGNRVDRKKVGLDSCFLPTAENLMMAEEAASLQAECERLQAKRKALIASIPKVSLEELMGKGAKEEDLGE